MAQTKTIDSSGKQAESKLEKLRRMIDEGENSGDPADFNVDEFLKQMKSRSVQNH